MNTDLATVPQTGADLFRTSTDAAGLCKAIVTRTAITIQNRKYVPVEGWQAIAVAHGCVASSGNVERIEGGFRAIGRIRRMDTGQEIATAEGFVGDDEKMWATRSEYAKRAMAQTRAISRACRSAFAHVVVMMNAGLSTTPAEEMTYDHEPNTAPQDTAPGSQSAAMPDSAAAVSGPSMSASQERLIRVKLKAAGITEEAFMVQYPHYALTPKDGRIVVPKGAVNTCLEWIETHKAEV